MTINKTNKDKENDNRTDLLRSRTKTEEQIIKERLHKKFKENQNKKEGLK